MVFIKIRTSEMKFSSHFENRQGRDFRSNEVCACRRAGRPAGQSFCKIGPIYREQGSHMPIVILERGLDLPGGEMIIKSGVLAPVTASGGAIICAMALAGWWFARMPQSGPASTPRPLESLASHSSLEERAPYPDALRVVAPSAASSGPRIDVARIMPNGDVVVAGWAEPGAESC